MKRARTSGSPAHTERVGSGDKAGAGQVAAGGPGVMAKRVTPANHFATPAAKGTPPKGMSRYSEE